MRGEGREAGKEGGREGRRQGSREAGWQEELRFHRRQAKPCAAPRRNQGCGRVGSFLPAFRDGVGVRDRITPHPLPSQPPCCGAAPWQEEDADTEISPPSFPGLSRKWSGSWEQEFGRRAGMPRDECFGNCVCGCLGLNKGSQLRWVCHRAGRPQGWGWAVTPPRLCPSPMAVFIPPWL